MKQHIENLLQLAVRELQEAGEWPAMPAFIQVDVARNKKHGDYATNIALIVAKILQKKPREIAEQIIQVLPASSCVQKIEIAEAGFINFFLSPQVLNDVVTKILSEKQCFGRSKIGRGKRVLVEFVSSNPTGPLHVGHGRLAAFGAVLSNLLDAIGFKSYREYYINDAGRQVDILLVSIWLRYLAMSGETILFPASGYQGDYVIEIAHVMQTQHQAFFTLSAQCVFENLPPDESQGGNKEIYMDALITRVKQLLGEDKYQMIFALALENIMVDIRSDLAEFGLHFDNWFSERCFAAKEVVDHALDKLKAGGHVYEQEGALWFRSSAFGDEKDRVLIRANGQRTYFANDIAYHLNKFDRGFDIVIDIFGSDHHGYMRRMKGAMEASGITSERLICLLVQFVTLYHSDEQVAMSMREGSFVPLRRLRREVGNDAARFFYTMRRCEQHMDFDLALAKTQSNANPVYYVQYAYTRICSVFRQLKDRNQKFNEANGLAHLDYLVELEERELLNTLTHYPDMIMNAALRYEPHQLTNYLRALAANFHAYYDSHMFLVDDDALRDARLALITAVKQTLLNGFNLLNITASESM